MDLVLTISVLGYSVQENMSFGGFNELDLEDYCFISNLFMLPFQVVIVIRYIRLIMKHQIVRVKRKLIQRKNYDEFV